MPLTKLLRVDWHVVAGAIAALVAMILHLLGLASEEVVRGVMLLLIALLLLRDLKQEAVAHELTDAVQAVTRQVAALEDSIGRPDVIVIGPKRLRAEFARFVRSLRGEVMWYHVCGRMFRRQDFFDATVGQLLANDAVAAVQFLMDERDRDQWQNYVQPKLSSHPAAAKARAPLWGHLAGGVSFIVGEGETGQPEALVGILEEPFAAQTAAASLPRYVLRIQNHSELLDHLVELARHAANVFESGHELALRPEDLLRSRVQEPAPAATRDGRPTAY